MRRVSVSLAVFVFAFVAPALARIGVELPNGFVVVMDARIEPSDEFVPSGVIGKDDGRIHRFVPDRGQQRYFAYDLVAVASGSDRLRVRIEPLSLAAPDFATFALIEPTWKAVPLLTFPLIPEVRAGDTVSIDLLRNPATGQRVVDTLTFTRPAGLPSLPAVPARDFALADVDLRMENARVRLNGSLVEASAHVGGSVSGGVLWFYLRDRGRFMVSLTAARRAGFDRLGEVVDRTLVFSVGRDRYSVESSSSIVPGEGRFNLYVRYEPTWRPSGSEAAAPFLLGAED